MSDFGFVNRRDGAKPSQQQQQQRRPPQQQMGRPAAGAGGPTMMAPPPRAAPMPRPQQSGQPQPRAMPRPAAPPLRQPLPVFEEQEEKPVAAVAAPPVSILKRGVTQEDGATPRTVSFENQELTTLKEAVADLTKKLAAEVKANKEASTQFYGLVRSDRALLFDSIPKEHSVENATAKADKNTWVKLSYPQARVERTNTNGTSTIDMYLRAYAIDPVTSNVNAFWVRDKAEDDSITFKQYAWYPTSP